MPFHALALLLALCASYGIAQVAEPPLKPPSEGPLSNKPPPSLPLTHDPVAGVPASGIPLSGVAPTSIPLISPSDTASETEVAATLVVFNSNEPESGELARFYAGKRGIPKEHVVGLECTRSEEIGRDEFDVLIANPLRKLFNTNHWWTLRQDPENPLGVVTSNRIRFVVLMRGMPLKILPATGYAGDKPSGPAAVSSHNEASVDSELSVLGVGAHPISGVLNNPYFRSYSRISDAKHAELAELMLVCRLDAPTPAIVRRMITDSLAAEQSGVKGIAYIDARGTTDSGYEEGDQWLFGIANDARRHGIPVVLDQGPGLYPNTYPMRHAAFYFGWYSESVSGPFLQPDFHFEPGAIAVHIHSFSASTLRDPQRNWCAPLLAAGAAATVGNVYEPYLDLTPHLDILFERLRSGFTFAESAYMSEKVLSWMTTFIGDPLYRPFPSLPGRIHGGTSDEWSAYHDGAVKWYEDRAAGEEALMQAGRALHSGVIFERLGLLDLMVSARAEALEAFEQARKYRTAGGEALVQAGRTLHSGVIFEGLGLLDLTVNARTEALDAFEQARKFYRSPDDILRVAIHQIGVLQGLKRNTESLALARKQIEAFPKSRGIDVVKMLEPTAAPEKHR